MFQYAAARAAAERLGCGLFVCGEDYPGGRAVARSIAKAPWRILRSFRKVQCEISAFPNVTQSWGSLALQIGGETLQRRIFPQTFKEAAVVGKNGAEIEVFDSSYFRITSGTWLSGYFQSEAYFSDMKPRVQKWFDFSHGEKNHVRKIIECWPAPTDRMCAIHVRRTDYLANGWALPMRYYRRALSLLPPGLGFAIFSDDIEFARNYFQYLDPWVSMGSSAIQDLALMSSCKFQVIANSSFSWWSAWLNRIPEKLVIAPNFHLGWYMGEWFPRGIKVDGWSYVDV
jgi:hypothetical protein